MIFFFQNENLVIQICIAKEHKFRFKPVLFKKNMRKDIKKKTFCQVVFVQIFNTFERNHILADLLPHLFHLITANLAGPIILLVLI